MVAVEGFATGCGWQSSLSAATEEGTGDSDDAPASECRIHIRVGRGGRAGALHSDGISGRGDIGGLAQGKDYTTGEKADCKGTRRRRGVYPFQGRGAS